MLAGCGHYDEGFQVLDCGLCVAELSASPERPALVAGYRRALMAYVDLFSPGGLVDQILERTGEPEVNSVVARLLAAVGGSPP